MSVLIKLTGKVSYHQIRDLRFEFRSHQKVNWCLNMMVNNIYHEVKGIYRNSIEFIKIIKKRTYFQTNVDSIMESLLKMFGLL